MILEKLKQQIVATVEATDDEALLQDIADILFQNRVAADESYYVKRLEESIQQAEMGS